MIENFPKGYKTLWEKEKLLVTSNFLFSLSVFKTLVLQTPKNQGLFGLVVKFKYCLVWERVNDCNGKHGLCLL